MVSIGRRAAVGFGASGAVGGEATDEGKGGEGASDSGCVPSTQAGRLLLHEAAPLPGASA